MDRAVSDELSRLRREREKNRIDDEEFKQEQRRLIELKKKFIMERRWGFQIKPGLPDL